MPCHPHQKDSASLAVVCRGDPSINDPTLCQLLDHQALLVEVARVELASKTPTYKTSYNNNSTNECEHYTHNQLVCQVVPSAGVGPAFIGLGGLDLSTSKGIVWHRIKELNPAR